MTTIMERRAAGFLRREGERAEDAEAGPVRWPIGHDWLGRPYLDAARLAWVEAEGALLRLGLGLAAANGVAIADQGSYARIYYGRSS